MRASVADPAARPWLRLLELVDEAAADAVWTAATSAPGPADDGRPLLDGVTLRVDARAVHRWTARLLDRAAENGGHAATLAGAADRLEIRALLQAAVTRDTEAIRALAAEARADPDALSAVAPLLPVPLLRTCATAWRGAMPADWRSGYCPVCGGWPTLAEARGLERARHLRCGPCGGDWRVAWLACPYCGNGDHERLRVLAPADSGEIRKVEACDACAGYVKTFTALTARTAAEVMREDLASIDLDVAALHRGYGRPPRPAVAIDVCITAGRRRGWTAFTRR